VPVIQLGKGAIRGPAATLALLAIFAAIAAALSYWRPSISGPMVASGVLWLAFIVYWSKASKNAALAKTAESAESRRVHELMMNGALLLLFIPIPGLRYVYLPPSPVWVPLGLGLQAGFFGLAAWSRKHLGRNWSGRIEIKLGHELVRSGPYRVLRHPIYTAMLGMFAGTAIVSGTIHALLAVALIMAAYARKIGMEESTLRQSFGPEYENYRRSSWALIPGLF